MSHTSSLIIDAQFVTPPEGIIVKNFVFDNEPTFISKVRNKPVKHFVIHETAGRTAAGCKRTLLKKNYGVHLILDRDGTVSCHADLASEITFHGNQLNGTSVGIEIVNPYSPRLAKGMAIETIPAEWWTWCKDGDRRYVLPTQEQLDTLVILVPWLCNYMGIPYVFSTEKLEKKKRKITGWNKPPKGWLARPKPGVVAHRDYASHADGRYPLEYLMRHTRP